MTKQKVARWFFLGFPLFLLIINTSSALDSDRAQVAYLNSDKAECRQKDLVCIYSGNVKFDQGSSHLEAPTLFIYRDNGGIKNMVALGEPAKYHTVSEENKTPVDAQAKKIEFDPEKNLIFLTGLAEIDQNQNKFNSEHIKYDLTRQIIFSEPSVNSLTTIVLQPKA